MNRRTRVTITISAICLGAWTPFAFGVFGEASAQDGVAGTEGTAGVDASTDEEAEVDVRKRADLSSDEQLQEAESIVRRGAQISRRVAAMLDQSRRERDIIRVTCLDDKLTQVNANLRTSEQRVKSLRDASAANDANRRKHEYTVITVLGQKFNVLEQEANQCVGQDLFDTGATRVTTDIDPDTPNEDPSTTPEPPPPPVPFIPPPASPAV